MIPSSSKICFNTLPKTNFTQYLFFEDLSLTEYLTEQEQIEILKGWIKEYGTVIVLGIAIAFIAIAGWHYWQQRQNKILSHASSVYDEMLAMRTRNDPSATSVQANKLLIHYPQTIYGQMAALMLAREDIFKKDYEKAKKHLNWVLDHSKIAALRQIARLRLARILIAEHKPEESINMLKTTDDKTFNGLISEVKGDAYLAMKNLAMARKSYQQALSELPNAEIVRPLLQMKYDDLKR